jgi:hypothetical protein
MDVWTSASWLNLNNIYTTDITYLEALSEYNRVGGKPLFLLEAYYENEHSMTPLGLRNQAYSAVLSGANLGHFFGNCPIWAFGNWFCSGAGTWQSNLDSTAATQLGYVGQLFESLAHYELVPDNSHAVLTSGYGSGSTYVAAAKTSDSETFVAYIPTQRQVTIDLSQMAGTTAKAEWWNPRTAVGTEIGEFETAGTQNFTPPDSNDWVLLLRAKNRFLPLVVSP